MYFFSTQCARRDTARVFKFHMLESSSFFYGKLHSIMTIQQNKQVRTVHARFQIIASQTWCLLFRSTVVERATTAPPIRTSARKQMIRSSKLRSSSGCGTWSVPCKSEGRARADKLLQPFIVQSINPTNHRYSRPRVLSFSYFTCMYRLVFHGYRPLQRKIKIERGWDSNVRRSTVERVFCFNFLKSIE